MQRHFLSSWFRMSLFVFGACVLLCAAFAVPARGVTRFAPDIKDKLTPLPVNVASLWFFDHDGAKVIPEVDLTWVAVVFHPSIFEYAFDSTQESAKEAVLRSAAQALVDTYEQVIDYAYDANLAEGACFLQLRRNMEQRGLQYLISQLNADNTVAYAHPTLRVRGRTYAFFNAFELQWKSGIPPEQQELIMQQAGVSYDYEDKVYRVDIFRTAFFTALCLLAEDVRVQHATPVLVPLVPSLSAELALAISGSAVGDKVPFSLRVIFSDRIQVDPGAIAAINLKPAEVQKELFEVHFDPYDYVEVAAKSPILLTGWIRCYAPGDFLIPSVTIRYTCPACSGDQVRSAETEAKPFRVSSLVPANEQENRLLIPMDPLLPPDHTASYRRTARGHLVGALLSFAAALGCLGWLGARWHRRRKEQARLRETRKEEAIADELWRLLQRDPDEPHWAYMAETARLVRAYVVAKYRLGNVPPGGSGKFFLAAVSSHLTESFRAVLQRVLLRTDEAVALEIHPFPEMDSYKADMVEIIGSSLP